MKVGSIAAGMGMHLHGLVPLGYTPEWAIEKKEAIAEIYKMNLGDHVYVAKVQDVDPTRLPDVDVLIVTLSCKNASLAKGSKRGEIEEDYTAAIATANILAQKMPRMFLLENVWQYRNFQSFAHIQQTLDRLNYYGRYYCLNSADWGVAQSRRRLYSIAVRDGGLFEDIKPPGISTGWYTAIADMLPRMPQLPLANWQKKKFPQINENVLLKRVGGGRNSDRLYHVNEPSFTIRAFGTDCDYHSVPGNVVVNGVSYALTSRACLRLFGDASTADKIKLCEHKKALSQEVVGNGASWVMFKALVEHVQRFV